MAAVAYVYNDAVVKFKKDDVLVVDASNLAIASGQTSASVLEKAVGRHAKVFSVKDLHSKVMLFDNVAVIGSANISDSSMNRKIEVGLITNDPTVVSNIRALLVNFARKGKLVDDKFIARIKKIKVIRRGGGGRGKRSREIEHDPGDTTWIVSTNPVELTPVEEKEANRGEKDAEKKKIRATSRLEWFQDTTNDMFRRNAIAGDQVVQVHFDNNWRSGRAYRQAPLLHRKNAKLATYFYLEESRNYKKEALPWNKFKALCKRIGINANIKAGRTYKIRPLLSAKLNSEWG